MLDGVVVPGRQGLAFRGAQVDEAWVERVQGLVRQREAATRCARCCDAQRQRARGCHAGAQAAECGSCAAHAQEGRCRLSGLWGRMAAGVGYPVRAML